MSKWIEILLYVIIAAVPPYLIYIDMPAPAHMYTFFGYEKDHGSHSIENVCDAYVHIVRDLEKDIYASQGSIPRPEEKDMQLLCVENELTILDSRIKILRTRYNNLSN